MLCLEPLEPPKHATQGLLRAREAGEGIKPGAQAPGTKHKEKGASPRSGRQRCRPFHGLGARFIWLTWGLRPRLYAFARFAGCKHECKRRTTAPLALDIGS